MIWKDERATNKIIHALMPRLLDDRQGTRLIQHHLLNALEATGDDSSFDITVVTILSLMFHSPNLQGSLTFDIRPPEPANLSSLSAHLIRAAYAAADYKKSSLLTAAHLEIRVVTEPNAAPYYRCLLTF